MKNKVARIAIMVVLIMSVIAGTALADGLTDAELQYLESHASEAWVKNYLTANIDDAATTGTGTDIKDPVSIVVGGTTMYLKTSVSSLRSAISVHIESQNVTDKTSQISDGLNLTADTAQAGQMLSGFIPLINTILGIIVTLISLGLGVATALDVCYIEFPILRERVDEKTQGGQKVIWFSDEAKFAVKSASVESGQNPLTTYFRKRVIAYIAVAIILFILLTGNISIVTNIVLKVVKGIMSVLQSLA